MPTIRRCCIVGCLSNSRQNPQLQFFQFPRPENPFHKLWKQACQASLSRILPFKKPVVCALHFRPNCIGGRRLTSSAVPSLHLDVPHDLKAVEQQAMIEEIERSRKCAYINAVVYEWLVRANLNPQLRGSITHGMIKEKAEEARRIIGSTTFVSDNRWLNRFRETHLTGFAQKLAANQLKPVGSSLWIPDIVQDLTHMFPPTNTDRLNFESVPEQYYDYMQQRYGEYEEDDDDLKSVGSGGSAMPYQQPSNPYMQPELKPQYHQQQPPQMLGHQPPPPPQHGGYGGSYEPYGHIPYGGGYDDYYSYQQQQQHQLHQQQQYQQQQQHQHHASYQHTSPPMPSPHQHGQTPTPMETSSQLQHQQQQQQPQQQPQNRTPTPTQRPPSRTPSQSPHQSQSSTPIPIISDDAAASVTPKPDNVADTQAAAAKRARYENADDVRDKIDDESNEGPEKQRTNDDRSEASRRSLSSSSSDNEAASENTTSNGNDNVNADKDDEPSSPRSLGHHNGHTIRPIQLPKPPIQSKTNGNSSGTTNNSSRPASTNGHSPSPTPNSKTNGVEQDNSAALNGKRIELHTYAQALEYLRPLEDFVLLKENFRAIGIISHLESVLRKARNRGNISEIANDEQL